MRLAFPFSKFLTLIVYYFLTHTSPLKVSVHVLSPLHVRSSLMTLIRMQPLTHRVVLLVHSKSPSCTSSFTLPFSLHVHRLPFYPSMQPLFPFLDIRLMCYIMDWFHWLLVGSCRINIVFLSFFSFSLYIYSLVDFLWANEELYHL